MNMAGRSIGSVHPGRAGMNGFSGRSGYEHGGAARWVGSIILAGAGSTILAGAGSITVVLEWKGNAYGLGTRRTGSLLLARMSAANAFGRGGFNNRIGSGLTGTSLNRASLSNNALSMNRNNTFNINRTSNFNTLNSTRNFAERRLRRLRRIRASVGPRHRVQQRRYGFNGDMGFGYGGYGFGFNGWLRAQ